jgi:hypothetical protein
MSLKRMRGRMKGAALAAILPCAVLGYALIGTAETATALPRRALVIGAACTCPDQECSSGLFVLCVNASGKACGKWYNEVGGKVTLFCVDGACP